MTKEFLAISYLRFGTQENSIFHHTPESGLLPIRRAGIHKNRRGSVDAISVYTEILNANPHDLTSRWLLNIAYMTLGEYPEKVPPLWLVPPEVFKSDYDIGGFSDVAPQIGLDVIGHAGGSIIEDFDGDGYLDIMASSHGLLDQLRYFRNNGDGSFTEHTTEAGLRGIVGGKNACHSDYNNDGFPDVLVLRGGWMDKAGLFPNSLLRNNGNGTFDDVTVEAGLLSFFPAQTASWGDYDNDGWLDFYIGNESVNAARRPCELYHNNGDGTFTDVAAEVGLAVVGYVKGVAWGDYNNDGLPDLYVSRLSEPNLLYRNDGKSSSGQWKFTEVGEEAGVSEPVSSFPTWFWDYDNDGWLDIFVSGFRGSTRDVAADYLGLPSKAERPRLYRNNQDGTFTDVTKKVGLYKVLMTMGCNFGDIDNDGFLDFYVGTGDPDFRTLIPNRMFRNADGKYFQDVTTSGGFGHIQKGHGVAFGDLDDDGDQDIYAVMGGAYPGDVFQNVLFENPGHGNHWITLRLEGVQSNRAAIGTRIRVSVNTENGHRDIYSMVTTGGSFGSSSLQQEIGLGQATSIRAIEIIWPSTGEIQVFKNVGMDQILKIREDNPVAIPIRLERFSLSPNTEKD
ncbi:MAG: CRTAC1 family protein [bacterium]